MTILMPAYLRASYHRHGFRHRRNALPKRLPRRRIGDTPRMMNCECYLDRGAPLLPRPLPLQPNPTNPTH
jgi:hypothetical protein